MARLPLGWLSGAAGVFLLSYGCGTQVKVAQARLSAVGESCEAPADCDKGLSCIDLVCRPAAQMPAPVDDAGMLSTPRPMSARSGPGESCARRADCANGMPCIERACRGATVMAPVDGPRKGGRGESCVASNDCERGMGCIGEVCSNRDREVSHVVDECHRVECVEDEDCCKDFSPEDPMLCDELQTSCTMGVQSDCNLHANLCMCSRLCDDEVCVASVECKNDLDCGGSGVLRCFAGKCAQCATDGDCTGASACVGGLCRAGCEHNEECPIFSVCTGHKCEDVGCQSDRDCFFMSGSARSKCKDHACRTPCDEDIACTVPFNGCVDGYCSFVGCESDEECRAALMLSDLPRTEPARAACRPPAE